MIRAEHLRKNFGAVEAVRDVSFEAANGAITGLLGPNGAGKSTTLRILCTVISADAGQAQISGLDVSTQPLAVRERIGVLPHGAGLYQNLTGRENIAYYGRLLGLGERLPQALEHVLDLLDLRSFADRRAKGYSQGERTRTALARALLHNPETLILDEPTAGLDVMATRALRDALQQLRAAGKCIVLSSHVMQEVAALCDRIVIVARGEDVAHGTPDEIRASTGCEDLEEAFVRATEEPHQERPS